MLVYGNRNVANSVDARSDMAEWIGFLPRTPPEPVILGCVHPKTLAEC